MKRSVNFAFRFFLMIAVFMAAGTLLAADNSEILKEKKLDKTNTTKEEVSESVWYDAKVLTIEGKGWNDTEKFYERLPLKIKDKIPTQVWNLGKNTAGIAVRFITNSKSISAAWDGGGAMYHMPATGNSGLDMYVKKDGQWIFSGIGRPKETRSISTIKSGLSGEAMEYIIFLPLYHNLTELKIGIDADASIAPAPKLETKPIVFYGTSITQGGCASRTGMCHTALLRRWLDREIINLGFSGSGRMEIELAELYNELDPALFVLECLPNMTTELVQERIEPFVKKLREKHPDTPIICTENVLESSDSKQNTALKSVFDKLVVDGVKNLYYVKGSPQLAGRENGTVDGVHPTDYGFMGIATYYEPILKNILEKHDKDSAGKDKKDGNFFTRLFDIF